jgi:hypothetical protein
VADLRISELATLAGANLAAGDYLAVADVSASESKKITVTDFVGNAVTLIADATIPNAKILFSSASIPGTAIANGGISATQLASDAVTAAKLADESTVDLVTTLPASGAFVGQLALDTDTSTAYVWDGSTWVNFKAAGSVNSVLGSSSGIVNISISTVNDEVTISTTLDNTSAAAQFLAGPTSSAGTVGYRTISGSDLPTATTTVKGGVVVNGNGLAMSGTTIVIDNTVTAETADFHIVQYDDNGLITDGRTIVGADVPVATASTVGVVRPGSGLQVDGAGSLNHTNSVVAGTAAKVTYDSLGHITSSAALEATDIPNIDAAKITSGTFGTARLANDAVTGDILADRSTAQFGEVQPTAEYIGQLYFNSLTRDIYIWDGNVWQPIGISIGEIVFAGTFDASAGSGTGLIATVTSDGTAAGFVAGNTLPAASATNNKYYFVVSEAGTITSGNAPNVALSPPDILLSNGTTWTEVDVSQTVTSQVASNVNFTAAGNISSTNVQSAIEELDAEKVSSSNPTLTGAVTIGTGGTLVFEGATADAYETTFTVTDPTADRTLTFPDVTGTVVTTGDTATVTNTMLAGSIAYSKLAALTSGNIVVGNASNVATSVAVTGDVTINNAGVTAISNGVIIDADINASAAIADTKLATISTAGKVSGTAITSGSISTSGNISTTGAVAIGQSSAANNTDLDLAGTYAQTVVAVSALDIDCSSGNYFTKTINGASTFTVSNVPASRAYAFTLELTHTSGAITWFTGVEWPNGTAPTLTTGKTHLFVFVTDDSGTRWRAASLINYTN